jgi:AraC family transcriptional regulator
MARSLQEVRRDLASRPLRATSGSRSWHGVALDEYGGYRADGIFAPARDHHVLAIPLGSSTWVRQERGGQAVGGPMHPGEAVLMPAGMDSRWDGELPARLRVSIEPASLHRMAWELDIPGYDRAGLVNHFALLDPSIVNLTSVFRAELRHRPHPGQDLIFDSVAVALIAHLLRCYGDNSPEPDQPPPAAGSAAIRRVLDHIHDRPAKVIGLGELAAVAGMSRHHFSRTFAAHVGCSPARYVERVRIEQAARLLRAGSLSIAQVAQAVGFSDQSHFTRRFRLHTGRTPSEFRKAETR